MGSEAYPQKQMQYAKADARTGQLVEERFHFRRKVSCPPPPAVGMQQMGRRYTLPRFQDIYRRNVPIDRALNRNHQVYSSAYKQNKPSLNLTNAETKRLIAEVEARPCLWRKSHPNYRKAFFTKKLWGDVGALLRIHGDDAKREWINVRDKFRKFQQESNKQSCTPLKPKWPFYDSMQFLGRCPNGTLQNQYREVKKIKTCYIWNDSTQYQVKQERLEPERAFNCDQQPAACLAHRVVELPQPVNNQSRPLASFYQLDNEISQQDDRFFEPFVELPQPVNKPSRPSVGFSQPFNELPRPGVGFSPPVNEMSRPGVGFSQPVVVDLILTDDELSRPVVGFSQPFNELPRPVVGVSQPVNELSRPGVGFSQPVNELSRTGVGFSQPVVVDLSQTDNELSRPGVGFSQPVVVNLPLTDDELSRPVVGFSQPLNELPRPGVAVSQPVNELSRPGVGFSQPVVVNLPLTDDELPRPGVGFSQPVNELSRPGVGFSQPVNELSRPSVGFSQPVVVDLPLTDDEMSRPVVGFSQPVVVKLPQPVVVKLPQPVKELSKPVVELPQPVKKLSKSVVELPQPVIELSKSVVELPQPVKKQSKLVITLPQPVKKLSKSVDEFPQPVKEFSKLFLTFSEPGTRSTQLENTTTFPRREVEGHRATNELVRNTMAQMVAENMSDVQSQMGSGADYHFLMSLIPYMHGLDSISKLQLRAELQKTVMSACCEQETRKANGTNQL